MVSVYVYRLDGTWFAESFQPPLLMDGRTPDEAVAHLRDTARLLVGEAVDDANGRARSVSLRRRLWVGLRMLGSRQHRRSFRPI